MELFLNLSLVMCSIAAILFISYSILLIIKIYYPYKIKTQKQEKPNKEENKISNDKIGIITIGINDSDLSYPMTSLKSFKDIMKQWKEGIFFISHNGALKCSEIKYIYYTLNDDQQKLDFWDNDGFDNDKDDDDKPKTPTPTGGNEKPEEDEDDKWLRNELEKIESAGVNK